MGIKITEQQLTQVLSELDVASITKAAQEYGKSAEDSQKKFQDAITQALGGKPLEEMEINESLIDYSLLFKVLGHILSPEQMQFMKDSYEVMHYTSIDHTPTLRTGEAFLFIEYLIYLAGLSSLKGKIKSAAQFLKMLPQIGGYIISGVVKRIKSGRSAKDVVAEFMDAVKDYSKNNDEIIQESLVDSKNSSIFAERRFTKKQIYETVSKLYEQQSSASSSKAEN